MIETKLLVLLIEIVSIFLFLFYFLKYKKNQDREILITTLFFAIIFENLNVLFSSFQEGGYYYSQMFNLVLFHTPIFIPLIWSILIFTGYKIVKKVYNSKFFLTLFVPIYVLLIDIILDIIAFKLDFWIWKGYDFSKGFFGIPFNNYLGWFSVVLSFLIVYEFFNFLKNKYLRILYLSFFPYIIFLCLYLVFAPIYLIIKYYNFNEYFFLVIVIFMDLMFLFYWLIKNSKTYENKVENKLNKKNKSNNQVLNREILSFNKNYLKDVKTTFSIKNIQLKLNLFYARFLIWFFIIFEFIFLKLYIYDVLSLILIILIFIELIWVYLFLENFS